MDSIYSEIVKVLERGERAALATVIRSTGSTPGKESAKMLVHADGTSVGSIGGGCTEADVWALARKVIDTEQPLRESFTLTPSTAEEEGLACGGIVEVFIEPIGSPVVYIFGAGHIGRHVVKIGNTVGLKTVVIDDRARFANREHFPEASDVVVVEDFEQAFDRFSFSENSYIVIVTRGHRYDELVLSKAVRTEASYVGLIGSKAKISRIFRRLVDEGVPRERLERVEAPIGLDIGCRTPEEIAVSIAAQLIAKRRRAFIKSPGDLPGFPKVRVPSPRPVASAAETRGPASDVAKLEDESPGAPLTS